MLYRLCQRQPDRKLREIRAFQGYVSLLNYLLKADRNGSLSDMGELTILKGETKYSVAQFLRSERVEQTVDALSCGWQRPEYVAEYARDRENGVELLTYRNPTPDTLHSDEWPVEQDDPVGPNWHIRAQIRNFGEAMSDHEREAQRARITVARLAQPAEDDMALQRAIASLARQLEAREGPLVEDPAPSVQAQLDALEADADERHIGSGYSSNQGYVDTTC